MGNIIRNSSADLLSHPDIAQMFDPALEFKFPTTYGHPDKVGKMWLCIAKKNGIAPYGHQAILIDFAGSSTYKDTAFLEPDRLNGIMVQLELAQLHDNSGYDRINPFTRSAVAEYFFIHDIPTGTFDSASLDNCRLWNLVPGSSMKIPLFSKKKLLINCWTPIDNLKDNWKKKSIDWNLRKWFLCQHSVPSLEMSLTYSE